LDLYQGKARQARLPPREYTTSRKDEIDRQFAGFHAENPKIWELFVKFTFQVIARNLAHYSADAVVHRIRWFTNIETMGDPFKINNNFVTCYARMFHRTYPEHYGFFELRQRISDRKAATGD